MNYIKFGEKSGIVANWLWMSYNLATVKIFEDRKEAGRKLGERLKGLRIKDAVVLAMPRGGVPVGLEIARILGVPLDVIIARKIGAPMQPELGIGAIAEGNIEVWDRQILKAVHVSKDTLDKIVLLEKQELKRRRNLYRDKRPIADVRLKTVILVDDGVATGITAKATIKAVKKLNPKKIIFATPVCAKETAEEIKKLVNKFVCLATPYQFDSVGLWYTNFEQISDEEVRNLLKDSLEFTP